jgi:hypothetical protein
MPKTAYSHSFVDCRPKMMMMITAMIAILDMNVKGGWSEEEINKC